MNKYADGISEIIEKKARGVPLTLMDMKRIKSTPQLQPSFIIHDLLPKQGRVLLYGKPKRGKSNISLQLSMHLANGLPIWNRATVKQSVLYLTTEQSETALADRIVKMSETLKVNEGFLIYYLKVEERNIASIKRLAKEYKPTFLIIDCLYNLVGETNDQKVIMPWLNDLDRLLVEFPELTLLIVHHRRKQGQRVDLGEELGDITDEIMGSGFMGMWANLIIGVARTGADKDTIEIGFECRDSKFGMDNVRWHWDRNKCTYEPVVVPPEKEKPNLEAAYRKEIVTWMKDNIADYSTTTRLVEAARDRFEGRRGWKSIGKYWDCWNIVKNELEFEEWERERTAAKLSEVK